MKNWTKTITTKMNLTISTSQQMKGVKLIYQSFTLIAQVLAMAVITKIMIFLWPTSIVFIKVDMKLNNIILLKRNIMFYCGVFFCW
jgi:hypothetical protein